MRSRSDSPADSRADSPAAPRPASRLRTALTARYALALGLVACTLLATHVLSVQRIAASAENGRLIDVSGMQRMLSQRIALLATELAAGGPGAGANATAARLDEAVSTMAANHAELVADWRVRAADGSPEARARYASLLAPGGMADEVAGYVGSARALLEAYRGRGAGAGPDADAGRAPPLAVDAEAVAAPARDGELLSRLDAVVKGYDRDGVAASESLERTEVATLALGLLVLLLEALLIFRPMVNRIVVSMAALDEANEELHGLASRLAHDLRSPIVDSIGLIRLVEDALSSGKVANASSATLRVYSSMVTVSGVIDELLGVVRRHREGALERGALPRDA